MTEAEARQWVRDRFGVSRETRLAQLVDLVLDEATRQNLVSPASTAAMWARHVVDSAQLLLLSDRTGMWLDIGTGAGFPGLVIACLRDAPIVLCEPRRRRAEFLERAAASLGLTDHVDVAACKVERLAEVKAMIISARAVAPLDTLFALGGAVSNCDTLWLLPKGRSAREEVAAARKTWHGSFHVEQSITDPDSSIVIASDVRRR